MIRLTQVMLVMATAMLIAETDEAQAQFRGRKGKSGSIQRSAVKQATRKTQSNFGRAIQRGGNQIRSNRVNRAPSRSLPRLRPNSTKPGNSRVKPFPAPGIKSPRVPIRKYPLPITGIKPLPSPITGIKPLPGPITGSKPPHDSTRPPHDHGHGHDHGNRITPPIQIVWPRPTPGIRPIPLPTPRPRPTPRPTPDVEPIPQPERGLQEMPQIEDIGQALEDFNNIDDQQVDSEELAEVKSFANKCLALPEPCGWWLDFVCWQWWDWCSYPWYWDCWTPCYWDYVFCPRQVVIIDGVQQLCEEVSYYLGVSGSQIPNFGFGIEQVKAGSPAEQVGLVAGDVIITVNGEPMTGQEVLVAALHQSGGVLDLEVVVQGAEEVWPVRVIAEPMRMSSF